VIDSRGRCFALIHSCSAISFGKSLPERHGRCGSGSLGRPLPSKIRFRVSSGAAGASGAASAEAVADLWAGNKITQRKLQPPIAAKDAIKGIILFLPLRSSGERDQDLLLEIFIASNIARTRDC